MKITFTVEITDELLRDAITFAFNHHLRADVVIHPDCTEPIEDEEGAVSAFGGLVKDAIAEASDVARHFDLEELAREAAFDVFVDHAPEEEDFDGYHEDARDHRAIQHRDMPRYYEGD